MSKMGIYVRVSKDEQKLKGISLRDQRMRGIEAASNYGYDDYEVFEDGGYSGTLPYEKRPSLAKLVEQIKTNKIQGIFVTEFDRLSRNHLQSLILKALFRERKVKLYTVRGETKFEDILQEFSHDMLSLFAQHFINMTSTSIIRALERNAIDGKAGGGVLLNYGYAKDDKKNLIIDSEEAKIVKQIFDLCIRGKGTKAIANILNDEGVPTKRNRVKKGRLKVRGKMKTTFEWRDVVIYRILTNPIYKGVRLFKGKEYICPAIIDARLFDAAQEIMKKRKNVKDTTNKYFYLLKGLCKCAKCNSNFYGRKRADLKDNQYICSSQRFSKEYCGTRGINIDYLNNLVWASFMQMDKDVEKFYRWYGTKSSVILETNILRELITRKIDTENQIRQLIDYGLSENIPRDILDEKMEELKHQLNLWGDGIERAEKQLVALREKDSIIEFVKGQIKKAKGKSLTEEEKAEFLRAFVDVVNIRWDATKKEHHIYISYKIDKLTEFKLGSSLHVAHKKSGWRLDKKLAASTINIKHRSNSDAPYVSIA